MGGGPISPGELGEVLTPELFALLVKARLPYPKHGPIDFAQFGRAIFIEDDFSPMVKEQAWPALIALSKIGLDSMPDLSQYLPPPTDPSYPEQCLGLQLLVDNCPRMFFRGVDHRWTYAYFSEISQRLAETWYALPPSQRPESWERWQENVGLDYWIGVRFWLGTAFVHSESVKHQEVGMVFTEETRSVVERISGQRDPYRSERKDILTDIYAFPRAYVAGPPQGRDVSRESWTFWMGMLMDVHVPMIRQFDRTPFLNAIQGRQSTEGEKAWIEKIGHFGEAEEDVAMKIAQDVKLGRWRPLGEGTIRQ